MKHTKLLALFIACSFTSIISGCAGGSWIVHTGDIYRGKVVDMETGEPIEGAVVAAVWYMEKPTMAGGVSSFCDAKDTLTDKNGEFEIGGGRCYRISPFSSMSHRIQARISRISSPGSKT